MTLDWYKKTYGGACAACGFERTTYRGAVEIEVHTCGVHPCPECGGYGVVDAAPMGAFAVIGGRPCPLCGEGQRGRIYADNPRALDYYRASILRALARRPT